MIEKPTNDAILQAAALAVGYDPNGLGLEVEHRIVLLYQRIHESFDHAISREVEESTLEGALAAGLVTDIRKADFSARTVHVLQRQGIKTIEALERWDKFDLLRLRNFGARSLAEVTAYLNHEPLPVSQRLIPRVHWLNKAQEGHRFRITPCGQGSLTSPDPLTSENFDEVTCLICRARAATLGQRYDARD
jgi:hypothetical protein